MSHVQLLIRPSSRRDTGFLETGGIFTADSSHYRQQAVGPFTLRNEGVHHIQCGFWNRAVTGKQHYRYLGICGSERFISIATS
jgi:hypothetical protein